MRPWCFVLVVASSCDVADTRPDSRCRAAFHCTFRYDAGPDATYPTCDVHRQTGCAPSEKCTWVRISTGVTEAQQLGRIGCAPQGAQAIDAGCQYGASGPTTGYDSCVGGAICVASPATEAASGTCRPICDLAEPSAVCTPDEVCAVHDKFFHNEPDDLPLAGICDSPRPAR